MTHEAYAASAGSVREQDRALQAMVMNPSLGWRFSGINATMEALLPVLDREFPVACCGRNLSEQMPTISFWRWLLKGKRERWRIWHARRNTDMLAGLVLRYLFRQRLILLWTSAAQRKHKWLTRFYYQRMDAVVATTAKAASFLQCDCEVSHHGVDTNVYRPTAERAKVQAELNLTPSRTLGVFGRIRPQKGVGDLVAALLKVLPDFPQWRVVFVGQVTPEFLPFKQRLIEQLSEVGVADRVEFIGYLKDFSDVARWYQAMDAVGCCSRNEGFGVTCLEAMASGVPVVATDAGAWADIVTPGRDGWIVPAGDIEQLAVAVRELFQCSAEELASMGQAAREKVCQHFRIEHEAQRLLAVYERLLRQYGETDQLQPSAQPIAA